MNEKVKAHWEEIYSHKSPEELSWYQKYPAISMDIILELDIPLDEGILDVGGGDAYLADALLEHGFTDITILDISQTVLQRARERMGIKANIVKWMNEDIREWKSERHYSLWHDRAVFHFLREPEEIKNYVEAANYAVKEGGYLIIGGFSENGPKKCSGLEVKQLTVSGMEEIFSENFKLIEQFSHIHLTPAQKEQDFLFVVMKRI